MVSHHHHDDSNPSSYSSKTSPSRLKQQWESEQQAVEYRVRERQWMYLGPIMAAPVAHIAVVLYRSARTPQQKQAIFAVGIVGSTAAMLTMRIYMMAHAGYPGVSVTGREKTVQSLEEKQAEENPTAIQILRKAFRGFG